MIEIDTNIDKFEFTVPQLNATYQLVERLKQSNKIPDNVLTTFFKTDVLFELSVIFYLGGFDIFTSPENITSKSAYYVKDVSYTSPRRLIFFSTEDYNNLSTDDKHKVNSKRTLLLQYKGNKWKKIKV
jgi:hypothetical protein